MSAMKTIQDMTATKTPHAPIPMADLLANVMMGTLVMVNPAVAKAMNSKTVHVEISMNVQLSVNSAFRSMDARPIPVHGVSIPMALTTANVPMALHSISGRKSIQTRDAWTLMNAGPTTLDMTVMKTPHVPTPKVVSHVNVTMGTLVMASHVTSVVMKVLLKSRASVKILMNAMNSTEPLIAANTESVSTLLVASYATANKDTK